MALFALGCSDDPEPEAEPRFEIVFQELDEALVSVWGRSDSDVFVVGSDFGAGKGPIVLHYDGSGWARLPTGKSGDLWWVHGFDSGVVLMGGADGQILRFQNGAFSADTTPATLTVFGIWGSSETDVWAVGGAGADGAFAWHYDGTSWTDMPLPAGIRETTSLFKVWGRGPDDVWLVGSKGTTLHWDGTSITQVESGTARTLFTVHADAEKFTAVGGQGDGVVIENDGSGWKDVTPSAETKPVYGLVGVCTTSAGSFAAGDYGFVVERKAGVWSPVELGVEVYDSFHGVWVDPTGGVWAVGGETQASPLCCGVMIHSGKSVPGGSYSE